MTRMTLARSAVVILLAILVAACSKTQPNAYGLGGGGSGEGPVTPGSEREFSVKVGDTVHFGTDSPELSAEAQQTLSAQAQWLSQYPSYAITIEGHADERGTREYNIALGAQRAAAVRQFLGTRGINPARIRTLSYGRERPVAVCSDISCWSQNRRAVTVLGRGGNVAAY